jgi:DNA-binding CsgD family transcriptional regulator
MSKIEQLSNLVGDIYDASLDVSVWPQVLEGIARYVPGSFVNLFSQNAIRPEAQAFYTYGIEQKYLDLYFEKYIHINPMFPATLFFEVGRIITEEDIMPRSEFVASRFFKEWVRPQGLLDRSMAAILDKTATSIAAIAVCRGERDGPLDEEAFRRMSHIVPHVRRAVTIGNVIDLHKVEAAVFADVLDGIAAGMYLVDGEFQIMRANARGWALVEEGSVLRATGNRLSVISSQADRYLRDTVAALTRGDASSSGKGIAIPIEAENNERYVAHVLPLTSGVRRKASANYSAMAAIFVRKAVLDMPHPLEAMANTFKLTPAEARVLMMVVQIGGISEVAPALGISEATVKTHLQRIFAKTQTARQADLVKIVAGYMSPLC